MMLHDFAGKHVLLLQGPLGPFFARLAAELEGWGAVVTKVNFNGGDAFYYRRPGALAFRGRFVEWEGYLRALLVEQGIDVVLLFGDCRSYHGVAKRVAAERGVPVYVFEEGYVRPDFVTLEPGGVNHESPMPKDASVYLACLAEQEATGLAPEAPVGRRAYWLFLLHAIVYAMASRVASPWYPAYRHHKSLALVAQGAAWVRGAWRKLVYQAREAAIIERLGAELRGRYFVVALQVHNDAQVETSRFGDVVEFIDEVVASFAAHAAPKQHLVVKHHPMDRPYRDYTRQLAALATRHGLEGRLHYLHDPHLPTLLKGALGTVVINSTVGLSSLYHGTPVKTLGAAVYDLEGLTFRGPLDAFWGNPGTVDARLYEGVRRWMLLHNQLNGSFYRRLPGLGTPTGLRWPWSARSGAASPPRSVGQSATQPERAAAPHAAASSAPAHEPFP